VNGRRFDGTAPAVALSPAGGRARAERDGRCDRAGQAYESVTKVWVPTGPWRSLIEDQPRKHKIAFEPL